MSDINAEYAEAYFDECQILKAEIARLQELLRGVGANRYWESRWRDADAEIARLKEHFARLNAQDVATNRRLRAALEGMVAHRGRPRREEYLSDAAFGEAARAFQRAQEALAKEEGK